MDQNIWLRGSRPMLLIITIAIVLLFAGLGKTPIYILDEARNAQCAREMLQRQDLVVPTFNEVLRPQKPPLHYYFMMVAYKVFGVNAFAARFFSGVCGLLLMVCLYFFTKRFANKIVALLASMILLSSTHWLFEFRLSVPDPYLILFFTATMFCMYAYLTLHRSFWLYLAAMAMALAVLSKGPVALGLAGVPVLLWAYFNKQLKSLFNVPMLLAVLLFTAIALPWYWQVHIATKGEFTRQFFLEQNLQRFNEPMEGHGGWFILIPVFVWAGLLPFSTLLGETIRKVRRAWSNSLMNYCLLVTIWVLFIFSISGTKLPNYPMLCYPFIAIGLAGWLNRLYEEKASLKKYPWYLLVGLNLLLGIGLFVFLRQTPMLQALQWWGLIFIALALACLMAVFRFTNGKWKPALTWLLAGYFVFNLLFLSFLYPAVYQHNPVTQALPLLKERSLYAYNIYNPAFNFYVDGPIKKMDTPEELARLWREQPDAMVLCREAALPSLDGKLGYQIIFKHWDIFETPVTVLIVKK